MRAEMKLEAGGKVRLVYSTIARVFGGVRVAGWIYKVLYGVDTV